MSPCNGLLISLLIPWTGTNGPNWLRLSRLVKRAFFSASAVVRVDLKKVQNSDQKEKVMYSLSTTRPSLLRQVASSKRGIRMDCSIRVDITPCSTTPLQTSKPGVCGAEEGACGGGL